MDKNPSISVVMPVYNAGKFLKQAIESILNQTYSDFEFIIINDGSIDDTESIILSYTDTRITYVVNSSNLGIVETLNKGIEAAKGKYLARMDADDIALPKRFEKQYHYMEENPSIAVCGAQVFYIDVEGTKFDESNVPIDDKGIKLQMLFQNSFVHPATFFRTEVIKKYKYQSDFQYAEDYYLLARIATDKKVANLSEPLLSYRVHKLNTTSIKTEEMKNAHLKVLGYQLSILFNEKVSSSFVLQFYALFNRDFQSYNLPQYKNVLETLLSANKKANQYDLKIFHGILHHNWYDLLITRSEKKAFLYFFSSPVFNWRDLTFKQFRRLFKLSLKGLYHS